MVMPPQRKRPTMQPPSGTAPRGANAQKPFRAKCCRSGRTDRQAAASQLQQESQGGGAQSPGFGRNSLQQIAASEGEPEEEIKSDARS
jgi:hypothetical protein